MAIDFPANPTNGQVYANYIYDSSITAWRNVNTDTGIGTLNAMGLKNVVPASIAVGSGSATVNANGTVTFTGASSVSLNGCFTSTYNGYKVLLNIPNSSATTLIRTRFRTSGTDQIAANYFTTATKASAGSVSFFGANYDSAAIVNSMSTTFGNNAFTELTVYGPASSSLKTHCIIGAMTNDGNIYSGISGAISYDVNTAFDGITFYAASGTFNGTITVYGLTN